MPHLAADASVLPAPPLDRPFLLTHDLVGHPLLRIDALIDLARRLPPAQLQYNRGDLEPFFDRRQVPSNGLTPEETLREIERCRSWMVIKHVETDPAYRALIDEVLDGVEEVFGRRIAHMHQREGYVFVSSPGSVTPLHMDPEHNVLWQIEGTKQMTVWPTGRQEVLPDPFLEAFYTSRAHGTLQIERIEEPGETWTLRPGLGLHVPLESPHYVLNGDGVSISFSTTWQSRVSNRKMSVHQFNAKARKCGLHPAVFGRRPWVDGGKYALMRAARTCKRLVGRGEPRSASKGY
jgi:hypothetical protein